MAFTIPDNDEAGNNNQSIWMQTDINALVAALDGDGVVSGCGVTAQGTPDMTVAVAAGTIQESDTAYSITGANATITAADGSNPRIDLVCAKTDDTLVVTAGTAAANPKAPDIPANNILLAIVYVPASDTAIETGQITDKRAIVPQVTTTTQTSVLTRTVLHDETLGSNGSFDVSSIDQTYDDLELILMLRSTSATVDDTVRIWFNNDTTTGNYHFQRAKGINNGGSWAESPNSALGSAAGASSPANAFTSFQAWIPEYANTAMLKQVIAISGGLSGAASALAQLMTCVWEDGGATAINRIAIETDNDPTDLFLAGSRLRIIGVKTDTILVV